VKGRFVQGYFVKGTEFYREICNHRQISLTRAPDKNLLIKKISSSRIGFQIEISKLNLNYLVTKTFLFLRCSGKFDLMKLQLRKEYYLLQKSRGSCYLTKEIYIVVLKKLLLYLHINYSKVQNCIT